MLLGGFYMQKHNTNGIIRKKKVTFAQVSSIALKDQRLSLRAKGLYAMIQNYVTLEDFVIYKNYLASISSDGKSSFDRAWDELKSNGYLVQYQMQDTSGKIYYEYDLLDEPRQLTEEETLAYQQKEANRIARNQRKIAARKEKNKPQVEVPPMDKTVDGSSMNGSSTNGSSTYINNTDINNTDINNINKNTTTTRRRSNLRLTADEHPISEELEVYEVFKNNLGKYPNKSVRMQIKSLMQKQDHNLIIESIHIAAGNNKEFNYARGILKNWMLEDIFTIDQLVEKQFNEDGI